MSLGGNYEFFSGLLLVNLDGYNVCILKWILYSVPYSKEVLYRPKDTVQHTVCLCQIGRDVSPLWRPLGVHSGPYDVGLPCLGGAPPCPHRGDRRWRSSHLLLRSNNVSEGGGGMPCRERTSDPATTVDTQGVGHREAICGNRRRGLGDGE